LIGRVLATGPICWTFSGLRVRRVQTPKPRPTYHVVYICQSLASPHFPTVQLGNACPPEEGLERQIDRCDLRERAGAGDTLERVRLSLSSANHSCPVAILLQTPLPSWERAGMSRVWNLKTAEFSPFQAFYVWPLLRSLPSIVRWLLLDLYL